MERTAASCKGSAASAGSMGGWGVAGVLVRGVGVCKSPPSVQCVSGGVYEVRGVCVMVGDGQPVTSLVN